MAYCIAMVLISLKICLIVFSGILSFSSRIFIEGMCMVALAPAVMTINGSTFHPLLVMSSLCTYLYLVLKSKTKFLLPAGFLLGSYDCLFCSSE